MLLEFMHFFFSHRMTTQKTDQLKMALPNDTNIQWNIVNLLNPPRKRIKSVFKCEVNLHVTRLCCVKMDQYLYMLEMWCESTFGRKASWCINLKLIFHYHWIKIDQKLWHAMWMARNVDIFLSSLNDSPPFSNRSLICRRFFLRKRLNQWIRGSSSSMMFIRLWSK